MAKILVIEDEESLRFAVRRGLAKAGHDVVEAGDVPSAWDAYRAGSFDVVLTDVNLGSESGIELVGRLREDGFEGPVIVMTAYGSVESAVRAMKLGADDYLQKPVSLEELALVVERSLEDRGRRRRLRLIERVERIGQAGAQASEMVGTSEGWQAAVSLAERVAELPLPSASGQRGPGGAVPTILILGETGSGKGVLARHIHRVAERHSGGASHSQPMVHINCNALPAQLVESELFGHEKGAFTDARTAREGLFDLAEGGTIFLDEIGDMPLELQGKLLTVIEDGVFRRVGGNRDRRVRARVITATNQDLQKRAGEGSFRKDLLYRLNTFTIRIPPLRDRPDDAVLLAERSLADLCRALGRPELALGPAARSAIRSHDWPGNAREVVNLMQRAAMLAQGPTVGVEDVGLLSPGEGRLVAADGASGMVEAASSSGQAAMPRSLVFDFDTGEHTAEGVERELIVQALRKTHGNVSKAARLIAMQRSSFRYRLEKFGLEALAIELAEQRRQGARL